MEEEIDKRGEVLEYICQAIGRKFPYIEITEVPRNDLPPNSFTHVFIKLEFNETRIEVKIPVDNLNRAFDNVSEKGSLVRKIIKEINEKIGKNQNKQIGFKT
jgi:hypothetical protein